LLISIALLVECGITGIPPWLSMSPVYVWMLIFFTRPHKVSNVDVLF